MLTFSANLGSFPAVSDLVNKMKGVSCTGGWDMVCAYGLDRINAVLAAQYQAANSKMVKTITLGSAEHPYTQTYTVVQVPGKFTGLSLSVTQTYGFDLGQPILSFSATQSIALLSMPIESSTVITSDCTLKLLDPQPANGSQLTEANTWYKLANGTFAAVPVSEVNAAAGNDPLASQYYIRANDGSLNGQTNFQNKIYQLQHIQQESPKSPLDAGGGAYSLVALVPLVAVSGNGQQYSGGSVVAFGGGGPSQIVLHFSNAAGSATTFSLYKGSTLVTLSSLSLAADLLLRIADFFASSVTDIDYALTSVANQPATADGITLTPKSFCFATQTNGTDGILSVFIQTNESGLPTGGSNLVFQDSNNIPFLPVSAQANTTVIYSRAFMSRCYFVQGLQRNNFLNVSSQNADNSPICVQGSFQTSATVSINTMHNIDKYDSISVDSVSIGSMPVTLSFDSGSNFHIASSISKGTTIHLDWTDMGACWAIPEHDDEGATINASVNKAGPLQWTAAGQAVSFAFTVVSSDYQVNVDSSISTKCSSDVKNDVNNQIRQQVAAALPTINIPMTPLSALAGVNLLFNGQQLFQLNAALGVYSPQDIVMFGNI